jgi:hypothetical protein
MKLFLRDLAMGVPLALGAMLTLISISLILGDQPDGAFLGFCCGLIGVPLLFASISTLLRR